MSNGGSLLVQLLPFTLISIGFAIGNYFLAGRLGKSRILWVVLSLIPIFSLFFNFYVWYVVVLRILDQLNRISARLNA
jgi:hypothetical protein